MSIKNDLVMRTERLWSQLTLPKENAYESPVPVIALEGHNGAGKSTIAGLISDHFNMKVHVGVPDLFLAGGLKYRMIAETNWQASALYFLSGVIDKIRELRELGNSDAFHLIDRSLWSTLSAHASEDPIRLAKIVAILHEIGIGLCEPDYTIILNATFEHCYKRIQLKINEEEKKLDTLLTHSIYYQKEALFYHWLGKQRNNRIFQINVTNRESIDVFKEDILPILGQILSEK